MRMNYRLQLLLLVLLCTACGSPRTFSSAAQPALVPIHGTSAEVIALQVNEESVSVSFAEIAETGCFARLQLPAGTAVIESNWIYSGDAVALAVATETGADLGIAPVGTQAPHSAEVVLRLGQPARQVRDVPSGSENRVTDLQVSDLDEGEVLLEWTEVNTGDYDFNGEVNIADIAPVALHFGETYSPAEEQPEELTLYWIDGDNNFEINISDLIPIGINFGHEIAGYYVQHNAVRITDPETDEALLFSREDAELRPPPDPLPPRYSAGVEGMSSDSWSVVPVGQAGDVGTISAGVISGRTFDAKASVIISGINLWQFEDSKEDNGFSMMWVIDPIDDVDWAHIGEKYVGPNGEAVFSDLPKETLLFLEIAYAPKTNLLTGEPVSRDEAIAEPYRTRMPFMLPEAEELVRFAPEIKVSSFEEGIRIDLFAELPTLEGTEPLRSRLLLPAGLVSYDTDGDASYIDQPYLRDTDFDSVSDQRIEFVLDQRRYEGGIQGETLHKGKVKLFDQAAGYLVLEDAYYWDQESYEQGGLGWILEPDPGEVAYNFFELTEFAEEGQTFMNPGSIIVGEELEVSGFFLSNLSEGLAKKHWAEQIFRRAEP